jgi:molybdopterin-guanine dinucleotide biosynthesis protein B
MDQLKVVGVVGLQDSGKTALVEDMTRIWTGEGLNVAVIKHDGHADAESDDWEKPGSDTVRAVQAGALYAMVTGGGQTLLRSKKDPIYSNPFALIRRLVAQAVMDGQPLDVVIVEGFKSSDIPKVAVLSASHHVEWLRTAQLPNLFGVICPSTWARDLLDDGRGGLVDTHLRLYDKTNVTKLCHDVMNFPAFQRTIP